jgi:hypothetical protein
MIKKCSFIFAIIILLSHCTDIFARGKCAVSYFENKSKNSEYDYLSHILPNSLSDSIKTIVDVPVLKPIEIDELLVKSGKAGLRDKYDDFELNDIAKDIKDIDYFIYGYYNPRNDETIDVVIYIYNIYTKEIFSFSTTGRLETELFNLIDAITISFSTLITADKYYKNKDIPEKSNLAFITNLEGDNLNYFYEPFLEKGYSIFSVQSNELYSNLNEDNLQDNLLYNTLKTTSFEKARTNKLIHFKYSLYDGLISNSENIEIKKYVTKYYYNYSKNHIESLKKIASIYKSKLDFIFIVIFDKSLKTAWLQCYDMRNFDVNMIWLQTGITGNGKKKTAISCIADDITERMINDDKK